MAEESMRPLREAMVEKQLQKRGISDARVLAAMREIPRHRFVPVRSQDVAYADRPVPIGNGQTISQPYIIAIMSRLLSELPAGAKVLEIGSGCGYQTAILVHMGFEVHSIEIIPQLVETSRVRLEELGLQPASMRVANGQFGLSEQSPYDAIIAAACAKQLPSAWHQQLATDGIIVAPVGRWKRQWLGIWRERDGKLHRSDLCGVRFVPLVKR